jgi:translation initiation factor 1
LVAAIDRLFFGTSRASFPMADSNDDLLDEGITNFDRKDAFEEAFTSAGLQVDKVHIRVQQRNRKKCVCTVQGLAPDLDLPRILKALKRAFKCNGSVIDDPEYGMIISLQGDHRQGVVDFLISQEIVPKETIVVHGF